MARSLEGNPVSFAAFKQMPWNHYGVMALEETQLACDRPSWITTSCGRRFARRRRRSLRNDVCLRLIADGKQGLCSNPD